MNTNHGKFTKLSWDGATFLKLKEPRKQRDYNENMQNELCYQCPLSLRYYDKLVKYWKRAGGINT
jgi:hypothetical protein